MFFWPAVFICLGLIQAAPVLAGCESLAPASMKGKAWQAVTVARILDGDTLETAGGERVRFIGINAPETPKPDKPGDALGPEAMRRLEALAPPGSQVLLRRDRKGQDHYGRLLRHVFLPDGTNITGQLLAEGLGFHVAWPPNLAWVDCYHQESEKAQQKGEGVWGLSDYKPVSSDDRGRLKGGYALVQGRVEAVNLAGRSAWIELAGDVSIKVGREFVARVEGDVWRRLLQAGQNGDFSGLPPLQVRGWLSDRRDWGDDMRQQIEKAQRKPFQFNVRHSYDWGFLVPASGN